MTTKVRHVSLCVQVRQPSGTHDDDSKGIATRHSGTRIFGKVSGYIVSRQPLLLLLYKYRGRHRYMLDRVLSHHITVSLWIGWSVGILLSKGLVQMDDWSLRRPADGAWRRSLLILFV
jgi:hypothetical protein